MNSFVEDLGRFQSSNPKMIDVVNTARVIAATLNPVMILGEAGTGRRELALEIHENSTRRNGRLIRWTARNFETAPEPQSADTVVIENVDSFSPRDQQVLFQKISAHLDSGLMRSPRWISTGCSDMMTRIRRESFSVRLYQMLSSQVLVLPNLQERGDDLLMIADRFVRDWNSITGQSKSLNSAAKKSLLSINFENNVSDLFDEIQKVYFSSNETEINSENMSQPSDSTQSTEMSSEMVGVTLSEMEKRLILQTLQMTKQNRTRAAEILGISIRTLRNKLSEYRGEAEL